MVVERGKSSVMGTVWGLPYTVAEEENTIRLQPWRSITRQRIKEPVRLLW